MLVLTACARQATPATPAVLTIDRAEAVQADWLSGAVPSTGWTPVTLMDYWNTRWPQHDGVVWYRVHWNQTNADTPVGILLEYVCMADAVYVNGSLIHRDPQLVEPLSRSWVAPQYFTIDKPLLHAGDNTLLVRVSGLASYQPGFGKVQLGNPEAVHALYQHNLRWRYGIRQFDFAISAVLGSLFGMFWLLRRKDTVYGWYALSTIFGAGYGWNYVADSPWPFTTTDAWQAFNVAMFVALACSFIVFLLRFCGRRWPRTEGILLLATVAAFAVALLAPGVMGPWRNLWVIPTVVLYYVAIAVFLWYATRSSRIDVRVLAASMLLPVLASMYDLSLYLELVRGTTFLGELTSPVSLLGMSFAVAWRFSEAMRRVEGFNVELRHEVDAATAQLGDTLTREHQLALANTRIGERLNLVRDLHDGFGGSLLGAIATLENPQRPPEPARVVSTLKELRDDLRLVIDTTTHEHDSDLAGLLAPLRHRWSQRLDVADIDSCWQLEGLDGLHLGPARSLDLLRLLQEALTNVLKHSHASRVEITVRRSNAQLSIEVRDNGSGFDLAAARDSHQVGGAGLASLRTRADRLGSELVLDASPDRGVTLRLNVHLQAAR
ncbi:histidine kinase [Rhodanobacter panaciterrae]|uniref:histidine kinase n=1 Tax=Rhodanobacter panaciterrae TaxID=490572 RepID=A0ABQ2ZWI6_9GAMM|nr:ATP-binding protein [Rhodanobacter panaciterrae]GGY27991.1 histidine kinase [Rhodanobacter panaciterrae]